MGSPASVTRVLFTARDVNAARNIAPIARQAASRPGVSVLLAAQGPALPILGQELGHVRPFRADPAGLAGAAAALLDELAPDILVTGVSGPDTGLDEAVLAARRDGLPAYVFQDFWGDMNPGFRPRGETFLVADEAAAALTRARGVERCVVVGLPKYQAYQALDPLALRSRTRAAFGAGTRRVACFFGQPLGFLPGYAATAGALGLALAGAWPDAVLLHRPHPLETAGEAAAVRAALGSGGLAVAQAPSGPPEDLLCACDLAATPFSSCGLDHLHLSRLSPRPLGAVLYLLTAPDVREHYRAYTGLEGVPPGRQGMAAEALDAAALVQVLAGLDDAGIERMWRQARDLIPAPDGAADRAVDTILADAAVRP